MAPRANPYRKSNPDTTLEMARTAAERLALARSSGRYKPADVDVLLDAFLDLDEHLSEGGDYPEDWSIDEGDADEDDDAEGDEDDDEDDDTAEPVDE
jgi:hypothetical protein